MKLLWLGNIPLPQMAQQLGLSPRFGSGWLDAIVKEMQQNRAFQIHYMFFSTELDAPKSGTFENVTFYGLPYSSDISALQRSMTPIVEAVQPDIVHIFGSEYPWTEALVRICHDVDLLDRTVLHIQGLVGFCRKHSAKEIPYRWQYLLLPRDLLSNTNIRRGLKEFERQAIHEAKALRLLKNVSGRTEWDKACAHNINQNLRYFRCNEILRETFYHHAWSIYDCQRHTIFISQGQHPIKGLHIALEALPTIIKHYPDTRIIVSGYDIVDRQGGLMGALKRNSYGWYLLHLLRRYNILDHVYFTGPLTEQEMCEQFLRSHVFVSPSTIENSPNSLGEAMLLGMPCVASFVGGVSSVLEDNKEGYLYQADASYMLAHYVMRHFEDDERACEMGRRAAQRAHRTHNKAINMNDLYSMYAELARSVK